MNRVQQIIEYKLNSTIRIMNIIGAVFILIMTFLLVADALFRFVFNMPISGANELIQLMMIFVVFFGLAYTQHKKENVSVGIIVDRLQQKVQAVISSFYYLLCLGVTCIITWQAFIHLRFLWEGGRYTEVLKIPFYPSQIVLFFGCLVLFIIFLLDFIHSLAKVVGR